MQPGKIHAQIGWSDSTPWILTLTLGLLSDTRKQKRKLGKEIILRARDQVLEIDGVRKFTKIEKIEDCNILANDYSNFLNIKQMKLVTEPSVTKHLEIPQLDDIVDGRATLVDLCDLEKVYCHTVVSFW